MNKITNQTAIISHLQHFSTGDGPGIRSTVFFQGCNLHCAWCHNPETIPKTPVLLYYEKSCTGCGLCIQACPNKAHILNASTHILDRSLCAYSGQCTDCCPADALRLSGIEKTADEVLKFLYEDIDFYKASGGGVTLSGGEPLLQADFCAAIAKDCKEHGVHVIIDTAGNVNYSAFEKVLPFTDIFYFDLKGANETDYTEKTGGSLELTVLNMKRLSLDGADVTARIPIITGYNDSVDYCMKLRDILRLTGVKSVHLLPFHRLGSSKYDAMDKEYAYQSTLPPLKSKMQELLQVFSSEFNSDIDG